MSGRNRAHRDGLRQVLYLPPVLLAFILFATPFGPANQPCASIGSTLAWARTGQGVAGAWGDRDSKRCIFA
eukprot:1055505-Rhodomonas_salina.2